MSNLIGIPPSIQIYIFLYLLWYIYMHIFFQAQVVMRVVDPKVAYGMLHRETPLTQQAFHTVPGVSQPGKLIFLDGLSLKVY